MWTTTSLRLIFGRPGGGLFWQAADGTGKEEALTSESGRGMLPSGVTPDGTRVLFSLGARDVMAMALDARRVEPLVQTQFNDRNGVVSPDGRWLAYESNASGKFEIYVTPFPKVDGAGEWAISTTGGTRPLWAPNSQELFFVAPDGAIMAVNVDPQATCGVRAARSNSSVARTPPEHRPAAATMTCPKTASDFSWSSRRPAISPPRRKSNSCSTGPKN